MLRVGTGGYGYHTWSPSFYPSELPYDAYLEHYARELDFCELNETFFHFPAPSWAARLAGRLPEGFVVSVKLHRRLTHERSGELVLARRFAERLRPLTEADRLGAVLAQFPFAFVNNPDNRAYLCRLRAAMELPMVAELRNPSWHRPDTTSFLRGWGIGHVAMDVCGTVSLAPPSTSATSPIGYVRFHGRRGDLWWQSHRDGGSDRYDYRYRQRELLGWLPRLRQIARQTEQVYVVLNQHGSRHALANARTLKKLLARSRARGLRLPVTREAAHAG